MQSRFHIEALEAGPPVTVDFHSSPNRLYTLFYSSDLTAGIGGFGQLTDTNAASRKFYRLGVSVP